MPRNSHAMAFDRKRGEAIVFGGVVPGPVTIGETWVWDGSVWEQRSL